MAPRIQLLTDRYIHALLNKMIAGSIDSMAVVTHMDLYMMHSIMAHYPINLGHVLTELITR